MPQKLPPDTRIDPTGDPLSRRPEHAALIARIAASWSGVEFIMAHLLGIMMRAESRAALALYGTLSNNRSARKALEAVALAAVPKHHPEIKKLMAEAKRRADERNRIVHGMWATAETMPDVLVCMDARHHLESLAHGRHLMIYGFATLEEATAHPEIVDFTYTVHDLENTLRRTDAFRRKLIWFSDKIERPLFGISLDPEPQPQNQEAPDHRQDH
jgi:hypothetical protein